jgi:4-hydroxyphenylpyruvate dioxygenase
VSRSFATNTATFGGTLAGKIEASARAGFAGIELWAKDVEECPGGAAEARRLLADSGLAIYSFQVLRDFAAQPTSRRVEVRAEAEKYFDRMQDIGAETLLVCATTRDDAHDDPDLAAADLAELGDLAHRRGLRIAFEALAWSRWTNTCEAAWRIARAANRANVGLVIDTFHVLVRKTPAHVIAAIPADRVFLVQVADAYMMPGIETIETARHHRVFPGEGDLDVAGLVRTLREAGYAGRYSLEIFNDGYRAEPANVVAKRAMQSLEVLFAKTVPRLAQPRYHRLEMTCNDQ